MTSSKSFHEQYVAITLFGLIGPLTWVLHFALVYLAQQFLCRGNAEQSNFFVANVIAIATGALSVFLVFLIWRTPQLLNLVLRRNTCLPNSLERNQESSAKQENTYSIATVVFLKFVVRLLSGLSLVAILWSASAVIFLNECGGPY